MKDETAAGLGGFCRRCRQPTGTCICGSKEPTQEQVQAMVDVWRVWAGAAPGLRDVSVNGMMRRAYMIAREMEIDNAR